MSSLTVVAGRIDSTQFRHARAIVQLSWREGWRMLTQPVCLALVAFMSLTVGMSEIQPGATPVRGRVEIHEFLMILLTYGALATLFAANLVATSARRTGAESQLGAAPLDPQLRTLATGVGVLLGPVAVANLLTLGLFFVQRGFGSPLPTVFLGWEYVQLPLTWLGAGLLGVALARWLPWPGVPLAAFVALIAWTMWSANQIYEHHAIGFLMPYVISKEEVSGLGTVSTDGQLGWHVVYLVGLCLLALAAALLRHRPLRDRAVFGFAVLAAALTASAAWLQLP